MDLGLSWSLQMQARFRPANAFRNLPSPEPASRGIKVRSSVKKLCPDCYVRFATVFFLLNSRLVSVANVYIL